MLPTATTRGRFKLRGLVTFPAPPQQTRCCGRMKNLWRILATKYCTWIGKPSTTPVNMRSRRTKFLVPVRSPPPKAKPRRHKRPLPAARAPILLLDELKSIRDPSAALRHLFAVHGRHHLDYPVCASLLHRLAKARRFADVDALLDVLRASRVPCQEAAFNSLICHFGRAGLADRAVALFHDLPSFNCPSSPSRQAFNFLLNALVDNSRLADARSLFSRCAEFYFRPNVVSYNIIIKGCLQQEGIDNARQMLDEMLRRRVRPSVATFNALIGFASRGGDLAMAMSLKEEMARKGVLPNAATYALLMEGMCTEGRYDTARKTMFDMEYQGCEAAIVNYGVLLHDRTRRGDLGGARELLAEMKRRRMKPGVAIYCMLIGYWCGEGRRVEEAYKVFVEMQLKGCVPNAAAYRMMMDGFCRAREFGGALRVLSAMLSTGHLPRAESFARLAVGLLEEGKCEEFCFVMEELEKRDVVMDAVEWKALVDAVLDGCATEEDSLLTQLTTP